MLIRFSTVILTLSLLHFQSVLSDPSPAELESIITKIREMKMNSNKLEKKTFSDNIRLLFIAGLEGTGHHGMKEMFHICVDKGYCHPEESITKDIMCYTRGNLHGLAGIVDTDTTISYANNVANRMKTLAETSDPKAYILGLELIPCAGFLSYPSYNGPHKTLEHPDAFALAELAEANGLDFRVIVLQRNATEILSSTMDHRHFGGAIEPKILINNAESLYTQLKLMDRKFFHCLKFHDINQMNDGEKTEFQNFLHPKNMPPIIDEMLSTYHSSEPVSETPKENNLRGWNRLYLADQLQSRINLIQELCENH